MPVLRIHFVGGPDVLLVRVLAFGVLSAAQSVVLQGERSVSGRKVATCAGCEWRRLLPLLKAIVVVEGRAGSRLAREARSQ